MVLDNVLEKYKVLVMVNTQVVPEPILSKIKDWCNEKGGLIIMNTNMIKEKELKKYPGFTKEKKDGNNIFKLNNGLIINTKISDVPAYYKFIYDIVIGKYVITGLVPVMNDIDGQPDKVFTAEMTDGEILFYNDNPGEITKNVVLNNKQEQIILAPYSIRSLNGK
jgi:hypothetical protein